MKWWHWGLIGGGVLGIVVVASTEKGRRRSRVLELIAILARDIAAARSGCTSVARAIMNWVEQHGDEWRRLLLIKRSALTEREEREEIERHVRDILAHIDACKDDPEVLATIPILLSLMPPAILDQLKETYPGFGI